MLYNGKIIHKDIYNHSSVSQNKRAEIFNKYKDDTIEINIYTMQKGHNFFFSPPQDKRSVKSYYILEGELKCYDTERNYSVGDIIVLDAKNEPFNFFTNTSLKILVQSVYDNSYEKSNRNFRDINDTLQKIQQKDAYTSLHSERVYEFTKMLAVELNYTGQRLRNILYAARYHDIGKIYIDDNILNKPSTLTYEEFEIMKSHVVEGKELVISCFGKDVYDIVKQHHERLDGSGYPSGLTKEEISTEGKIIAICDSFDAMTTDRVYKRGKSISEAKRELRELKDVKYESYLVDIFIDDVLPKLNIK